MEGVRLEIPSCPPQRVRALVDVLGVSDALAQALVRRGHDEPRQAKSFLDADVHHDVSGFTGIDEALQPILRHVCEKRRITVHGDYDVDGVCATAILVGALRSLGAEVDWHIPERSSGYGLSEATIRELASRRTSLLITVDCGITSVAEVALARQLGIEVVITDHHAPRADGAMPDAPIMHPSVCDYPCRDLCAAAVAHKLTLALCEALGHDASRLEDDLDLVALATVADVVPLLGENRMLLRRGLIALRRTTRPGLRALIAVAGLDPLRIDTRAIGFALAPRINAAGRLHSAATALELLLTQDQERAERLAFELDRCNRERRATEQRILIEAEAQVRELGPQAGYVLAGERWHPGVVGIVAARIAERHNRPAVLVAIDGQRARGSGRSIKHFDLLGGLHACAPHLARYGGHRAAAGVELELERLATFREAFAMHAAETLTPEDLLQHERVDAIVGGACLHIDLAEELAQLAPFGKDNPEVSLLVRDAHFRAVKAMGEGKHARFQVLSEDRLAGAVAFGKGVSLGTQEDVPVDATFKLEVNEWRGTCEPRLVLRHVISRSHPAHAPDGQGAHAQGGWGPGSAPHAAPPANDEAHEQIHARRLAVAKASAYDPEQGASPQSAKEQPVTPLQLELALP